MCWDTIRLKQNYLYLRIRTTNNLCISSFTLRPELSLIIDNTIYGLMNIVSEILFEGVSVTFATVRMIIVKVIIYLVVVMNLVFE